MGRRREPRAPRGHQWPLTDERALGPRPQVCGYGPVGAPAGSEATRPAPPPSAAALRAPHSAGRARSLRKSSRLIAAQRSRVKFGATCLLPTRGAESSIPSTLPSRHLSPGNPKSTQKSGRSQPGPPAARRAVPGPLRARSRLTRPPTARAARTHPLGPRVRPHTSFSGSQSSAGSERQRAGRGCGRTTSDPRVLTPPEVGAASVSQGPALP